MFRSLCLITIVIISSCAHKKVRVEDFVQTWKLHYQPDDENYAKKYSSYLKSVEKVFKKEGKEELFPSYLDSIENSSQKLSLLERSMEQEYKRDAGPRANTRSSLFGLYKTRKMTKMYDELVNEREENLRKELGEESYEELKENYAKFLEKESAGKYAFPL